MAPTVSLEVVTVSVHVFIPDAVEGLGLMKFGDVVQFEDHPPKVPVLPAG
jgi:hypothetical protein